MTKRKPFVFFQSTVLNFITVLISACIVSTLLFCGLNTLSDSFITRYVRDSNFVEKDTSRIVNSLQSYVNDKKITTRDIGKLAEWAKSEKYMHLIVLDQGKIIFDSDVANGEAIVTGTVFAPNYIITLRDHTAPIYLDSFYEYRYSEIAMFIELVVSFFFFTLIVVFFVARHLAYIRQIVFGIEVLEGGNLEYEIPVRGNDELSLLAGSLNEMRKVFMRKNDTIPENGRTDIADLAVISHDLRTPLTTLILFIEIIKTKKDMSESERNYYIQKLSIIANKIKVLAENLEDFTSDDWQYPVALDPPRPVCDILREVLPEAVLFLEERGFSIRQKDCVKRECIKVNNHFIYRIIDNAVSNIDRYADHDDSVIIETRNEGDTVSISFINSIAENSDSMRTSKLGLSLVKEMMLKMNGTCLLSKRSNRFTLKLTFPIVSE